MYILFQKIIIYFPSDTIRFLLTTYRFLGNEKSTQSWKNELLAHDLDCTILCTSVKKIGIKWNRD